MRNFGLSFYREKTSGPASGGNRPLTRSLAVGASRDSNSMRAGPGNGGAYGHLPATSDPADQVAVSFAKPAPSRRAWPNSDGDYDPRQPFIPRPRYDERELAASIFVGGFLALIGFFMFALVFFSFALFDFG